MQLGEGALLCFVDVFIMPTSTTCQSQTACKQNEVQNITSPTNSRTADTPRYQTRQHFGSWHSKSRKRPRSCVTPHENFYKDVILLQNPEEKNVVKQNSKQKLYEMGHILNAFEFSKNWDSMTVMFKLRDAFHAKIPDDVSVEFMMGCGNKLVVPTLSGNQELNGRMLHKIFGQKTLYLKPSRSLNPESEDEVEKESEIVLPESRNSFQEEAHASTHVSAYRHDTLPASADQIIGIVAEDDTMPAENKVIEVTTVVNDDIANPTHRAVFSSETELLVNQETLGNKGEVSVHLPITELSAASEYNTYLNLISTSNDSDSEFSEDLNEAMRASIEDQLMTSAATPLPAKEILLDLASKIRHAEVSRFNINRANILDGALRGFRRATYSPNKRMSVKFSDDMGKLEEAVDLGGPRREFLRLLMHSLEQSPMFEGAEGVKNLALSSKAVREDLYFETGRMIAVCLVHGGPAPGFFSPTLFSCLATGPETAKPVIEDVADFELLEKLKKISDSTCLQNLQESTEACVDYLINAGCFRPITRFEEKDILVQDILMFQVVNRVRGPFERFKEGMKTLGILEKIKQYPDTFFPLLCHKPIKLTADILDGLFHITFSIDGSNRKFVESRVVAFWRDYLQDTEEGNTESSLECILAFATGSSTVPPVGFCPEPSLEFLHPQDVAAKFPIANTCVNCLRLPLLDNYENFKTNMDFAICNTQGFGIE